jgi:hypothetical protein
MTAAPDPIVVRDPPTLDRPPVHHSADLELFRRVIAALIADPPESDGARLHGIEAAAALVAMAVAGDTRLARILRPDPDDAGPVTWTVACYQIGDVSPATLKDFSAVDEAVRAAARCDDAAHVAAELVASSASGLRWTAMARTGEMLRFQLPGASTGWGAGVGGTLDATHRWSAELARWEGEADEPVETPGPRNGEPVGATPPELRVALGQIVEAMQGLARRVDDLASGRDVRERLYLLEQKVGELQRQFRLSSFASATGRRDLELARSAAEAPARRLSRPGVNARLLATLSGRRARVSPPLTERVLIAINRATARALAAARHQRARSPQGVERAWPEELP